ncbi:MAG: alpha/beta hydrolase [Oscillospiraceae bacterium]|nr:alpha/beta hydrolase [Oscillospiraceae bacterium]
MNWFIRSQLAMVRGMYEAWMGTRKQVLPDEVEVFSDIPYIEDGQECHKLDVYRPKGAVEKLPVIVDLHGGGLLLCSRKTNRILCSGLARRGFLVFCLGYPLVPEADVPQMLRDVAVGMDKVAQLLRGWGGDPDRVYLVGDSAGAFLAAYELAAQKEGRVADALGMRPSGLPVKGAAFFSGMFYTAKFDQVGACLRKDFYGKKWRKHPFRPYMDPAVPEVAGAMPPCVLVTSKLDHLRGYTKKFAKGLRRSGVDHTLMDLPLHPALQHDFVIVKPEHPKVQQVIDRVCQILVGGS